MYLSKYRAKSESVKAYVVATVPTKANSRAGTCPWYLRLTPII